MMAAPGRAPRRSWAWLLPAADPAPAEAITALAALAWGLWVLNPWLDTFDSATFGFMARLAPEPAWALPMIYGGGAALVATAREGYGARRLAMLGVALLWTFWAVAILVSNLATTASAQYAVLAAGAGWAYLRLGVLCRQEEAARVARDEECG
jgi:hypothetical protein